ncbi:hypothetical protein ACEP28_34500, partial [Pseudomonas aeruginosa]
MKSKKVEAILERSGPCLSTALAERLVKLYGVSAPNARQLIQRSGVKRLKGIRFPHRTSFVYLTSADSTPSGHPVHAYPAGHSTHIRPPV